MRCVRNTFQLPLEQKMNYKSPTGKMNYRSELTEKPCRGWYIIHFGINYYYVSVFTSDEYVLTILSSLTGPG